VSVAVKICGITDPVAMDTAVQHGAAYVGLVFFPKSPRFLSFTHANELASRVPTSVQVTALTVNPTDDLISEIIQLGRIDLLQLHGDETPNRVADIRSRYGIRVMKALRIATEDDLEPLASYEAAADMLLFDTKAPPDITTLPGGTGLSFDWRLMQQIEPAKPWMLAGGLKPENLAEAVRLTGARIVDVSSSVEDRPGHKSPEKIKAFLAAAAALN
jgi:phosphoribosylanthranilate isomerase